MIAFSRKLLSCNNNTKADESPKCRVHVPKDTKSIIKKIKHYLPVNGTVHISAQNKAKEVEVQIVEEGKKRGKKMAVSAKHCKPVLLKYKNNLLVSIQ